MLDKLNNSSDNVNANIRDHTIDQEESNSDSFLRESDTANIIQQDPIDEQEGVSNSKIPYRKGSSQNNS